MEEKKMEEKKMDEDIREWSDLDQLNEDLTQELLCTENRKPKIYQYPRPTLFQFNVLDGILTSLSKSNVPAQANKKLFCISAPGGKGKTLCFLIPAVNVVNPSAAYCVKKVKSSTGNMQNVYSPQALIICHSLPLIHQTAEICKQLVPEALKPKYPDPNDQEKKELKNENGKIYVETIYKGKRLENYGQILVGGPAVISNLITGNKGSSNNRKKKQNFDEDDDQQKENLDKLVLDELKLLIIDEADNVVDNFKSFIKTIIQNLVSCQRNLFWKIMIATATIKSDTISQVSQQIIDTYQENKKPDLCKDTQVVLYNYTQQKISAKKFTADQLIRQDIENLRQNIVYEYQLPMKADKPKEEDEKQSFEIITNILVQLYEKQGEQVQVLIFAESAKQADSLAHHLAETNKEKLLDRQISSYTKNVDDVEERIKIFEEFRKGHCSILVATNALARGIDIRAVCLVINLFMPRTSIDQKLGKELSLDPYMFYHRIARVGRFDDKGVVLNIYRGSDYFLEADNKINKALYQHFQDKFNLIHLIESVKNLKLQEQNQKNIIQSDEELAKIFSFKKIDPAIPDAKKQFADLIKSINEVFQYNKHITNDSGKLETAQEFGFSLSEIQKVLKKDQ